MDGTLLDGRGEVDLPRLERLLDHLDQKGIRFVIATGNEIHRMRQLLGPLVKRVTLVVANGARIFENDQMVLGKFWDRELVEAVLAYLRAGKFQINWLYQLSMVALSRKARSLQKLKNSCSRK